MAALRFIRFYSDLELMVIGGVAIAAALLLGLLANAILGGRGFGIFGNSFLVVGGWGLAVILHNWLVRQPDFLMIGFADIVVLIALATFGALTVLLGAAFMKKYFA